MGFGHGNMVGGIVIIKQVLCMFRYGVQHPVHLADNNHCSGRGYS